MNICAKCHSKKIKVEHKNFNEDLHNILKIFVCQDCGHKKDKLVNLQEGSDDKRTVN